MYVNKAIIDIHNAQNNIHLKAAVFNLCILRYIVQTVLIHAMFILYVIDYL